MYLARLLQNIYGLPLGLVYIPLVHIPLIEDLPDKSHIKSQ